MALHGLYTLVLLIGHINGDIGNVTYICLIVFTNIGVNMYTGILHTVLPLFLQSVSSIHGYISGAYVLPHGGVALDPYNFNTTNVTALLEAKELHQACLKVGQAIAESNPDIIVLSTPHGLADYRNFLVYMNSQAEGYGVTDDCLNLPCQYNLSLTLDTKLASILVSTFGYDRNVSALSAFGPLGNSYGIPLRWGEVIPLYFTGNVTAKAKVVILSQPTRRYTDDVAMIPELLNLGEDMFHILENMPNHVAVVISSDLAHTHSADGPYGYSNTSQPFDDAIGDWAKALNAKSLLVTAAGLVDRALSCGFTGLVMLHGMLSKIPSLWQPQVYANLHPSYYGMMAAEFKRTVP